MITAPTRFWIPVASIGPAMAELAQAFGLTIESVSEVLAGPITGDPPATGSGLVVIEQVRCLTWSNPACMHGGYAIETALAQARIPYLRRHAGGTDCSAGASAFHPDHPPADIACNLVDEPVVVVEIIDGQPLIDREALDEIRRYAFIRRLVLAESRYLI